MTDDFPAEAAAIVQRHIEDEHGYLSWLDTSVDAIERGIEAGAFRDVDADLMGQHLTDTIHVGRERRISLGHDDAPEEAREAIHEFVLDSLYLDE